MQYFEPMFKTKIYPNFLKILKRKRVCFEIDPESQKYFCRDLGFDPKQSNGECPHI